MGVREGYNQRGYGKTQTAIFDAIGWAKYGQTVWFVYRAERRRIAKEIRFRAGKADLHYEEDGDEFRFRSGGKIILCTRETAPKEQYLPNRSHRIIHDHRAREA